MDVIIYHNPDCGTSRNTLGLIHNAGIEPHVIEYLKTPPTRALLVQLIKRMGISVRALLRKKGTPYDDLGLDDPKLSDENLLDQMMAHPILDQPPDRGDARRRQAVPAVGNGARHSACDAARRIPQGGRRIGGRFCWTAGRNGGQRTMKK